MGSAEALTTATSAVSSAAATGSWVLVKNVHLAPQWLQNLEKRLDSLKPHPEFRLFLSMESSPKIPVNLLRASRVLMFEQPAGIKANMRDSLASLRQAKGNGGEQPVEKTRVYFLLSFLHAIIQERLRYAPRLGWHGFWEFNDSDFECAVTIIDYWISTTASGRSNIAPSAIPWEMIRRLVAVTCYGGKIDNADDFAVLTHLVATVFTPAAFEESHSLALSDTLTGEKRLEVPGGIRKQEFNDWVGRLPEREPPSWLGLEEKAEKLLLSAQATEMVGNLKRVMGVLDEGEAVMAEAE